MARFRPAAPCLGALAAILLLAAGCSNTPTRPVKEDAPAPMTGGASTPTGAPAVTPPTPAAPVVPKPATVVVAKPATITGSEETSTMFDNFTAYIASVDGQLVAAGRLGWNTPLSLPAGPHRLTVAFNRGVFTAKTEVQLNARAEAVYQLKFASDAEIFGKNSYCEFWIVDVSNHQKVVAPTRVPLTRIDSGK